MACHTLGSIEQSSGSPYDPFPGTILCSSDVTCCIERIYRNYARTVEAETMSRRQDRFPFFPVISVVFFHIGLDSVPQRAIPGQGGGWIP